jgi:simple sugar transport system substrate-binding protein
MQEPKRLGVSRRTIMIKKSTSVAALFALVFGLTGAAIAEPTFIMITHSPESDTYWVSVSKGLQQAGADLGVKVEYRGVDNNLNDPNQQRRNLEAAIAAKPDGVIVSDPTPASLNANTGDPGQSRRRSGRQGRRPRLCWR